MTENDKAPEVEVPEEEITPESEAEKAKAEAAAKLAKKAKKAAQKEEARLAGIALLRQERIHLLRERQKEHLFLALRYLSTNTETAVDHIVAGINLGVEAALVEGGHDGV